MEEKKSVVARSIILGIAMIALGILGIIFRGPIVDFMSTIVKWIIGGILIVAGIIAIVMFVKDRSQVSKLIIGILSIAAGILMFIFNLIVWIIAIFLDIVLLVDGGYKIREALAANKAKAKNWYISLILGIINVILGALAIISPIRFGNTLGIAFIIVISVVLIVSGIQNMVHGVMISKV